MIPIPYAVGYEATLEGKVPKEVKCEKCGNEFIYFLVRKGIGTGTSLLFLDNAGAQSRAQQEAEQRLLWRLSTECDPIPCPQCGWYQEYMIPRARYLRYRWFIWAVLGVAAVNIVLFILAVGTTLEFLGRSQHITFLVVGALWLGFFILGGGAAAWLRYIQKVRSRYDPNHEDLQARIEVGKHYTMPKREYVKLAEKYLRDRGNASFFP